MDREMERTINRVVVGLNRGAALRKGTASFPPAEKGWPPPSRAAETTDAAWPASSSLPEPFEKR